MARPNNKKENRKSKEPYSTLSGDEKISRNWTKAIGLFHRGDYSVSILRCATCLELTTNFIIRQELVVDRKLPIKFVDSLLAGSNGLRNKYFRLYLPVIEEWTHHDEHKKLWKTDIEKTNIERNKIIHGGEFKTKATAKASLISTEKVFQELLSYYDLTAEFTVLKHNSTMNLSLAAGTQP